MGFIDYVLTFVTPLTAFLAALNAMLSLRSKVRVKNSQLFEIFELTEKFPEAERDSKEYESLKKTRGFLIETYESRIKNQELFRVFYVTLVAYFIGLTALVSSVFIPEYIHYSVGLVIIGVCTFMYLVVLSLQIWAIISDVKTFLNERKLLRIQKESQQELMVVASEVAQKSSRAENSQKNQNSSRGTKKPQ